MVKLFRKNSNLCDHNPPTSEGNGTDCAVENEGSHVTAPQIRLVRQLRAL